MGRASEGEFFVYGPNDDDAAERLINAIYNEIIYPHWKRRCFAPHLESIMQSEYVWDTEASEPFADNCGEREDGQTKYILGWILYHAGPDKLFAHWLDLSVAAQWPAIVKLAKRYGFSAEEHGDRLTKELAPHPGRDYIFYDTGDDLLLYWDFGISGQQVFYRDVVGRFEEIPATNVPPATRAKIHHAVETGLCHCPMCNSLRGKVD